MEQLKFPLSHQIDSRAQAGGICTCEISKQNGISVVVECYVSILCSQPDLFILQLHLKNGSEQQNSPVSDCSAGHAAKRTSHCLQPAT